MIQNSDGFSPISAGAAAAARQVPGVELVASICAPPRRSCSTAAASRESRRSAATSDAVLNIDWTEGRPGDAAPL